MQRTGSVRVGEIIAIVCGVAALSAGSARGQTQCGWVPFVATQTVTVYNISGGKRVVENQRIGPYVRDACGSIYNRTVFVSGSAAGQTGPAVIQNRETGATYQINYAAKQATIVTQPAPGVTWSPPLPPTSAAFRANLSSNPYLGTKVVNGVECEGWQFLPSAGGMLTGEAWRAPSLNYADVLMTLIDKGKHAEFDFALENIQVGQAPDPRLFRVPAGFGIVNK